MGLSSNKHSIFRTDPNTQQILESMRSGSINIKQAAEALGMEPAMLAYQLAGKVRSYHVCYQVTVLLIVTKLPCYSLLLSRMGNFGGSIQLSLDTDTWTCETNCRSLIPFLSIVGKFGGSNQLH